MNTTCKTIIVVFVFLFHSITIAGMVPFGYWRKQGAEIKGSLTPVSQASATSITLPVPTGIAVNDLLYAFVLTFDVDTTATTGTPSGWTLVNSAQHNSNMYIIKVYRRIATGSDGTNVTFNFTETVTWSQGIIVAYSPANTLTPEDSAPVFSVGNCPGSTVTATGVTTVSSATRVIHMAFSTRRSSPSYSPPSGFTSRVDHVDAANNQSLHLSDRLYINPEATGNLISTGWGDPTNNRYLIAVIAIKQR